MTSVLEGSVFPIQLEKVSVERDGQEILASCDLTIEEGEKIAHYRRKWIWKNNLTEPNLW